MLVRAVLAPQGADDPQLGEGRRPPEHGDHAVVLVGREAVLGDECRRDGGIARSGGNGHQGFLSGAGAFAGAVADALAGVVACVLAGVVAGVLGGAGVFAGVFAGVVVAVFAGAAGMGLVLTGIDGFASFALA